MGLNYDIAVKVLDTDGVTPIANAKVHAYFNKVNNSSSNSLWNTDLQRTTGTGKTSFNLGDNSFLTSNGKVDNGDTILVAVWLTNNSDKTIDDKTSKLPNTITRCIVFVHTVDTNSSSYEEKIILLPVQKPICDFTIPTAVKTGHNFTITNNNHINEGAFSFDIGEVTRADLYQQMYHYSQDLFLGLEIEKTNYNLGEVNVDKAGILPITYAYINAGDYNCRFTVTDFLGFSCYSEVSYHILFNKPTISFDFTFTKLKNTDKHIGVGNDDLLVTSQLSSTNFGDTWALLNANFDWSVEDLTQTGTDNGDIYLAKDELFKPTKLYLSEGTKKITLKIHWNDGFDARTEVLELNPFLDVYKIWHKFSITTQKAYKIGANYIPLGDDDLVTVKTRNVDNTTQNYISNDQWISLEFTATKKKNDGTADNEVLTLIKADSDNYYSEFKYFIKFLHNSSDYSTINQKLIYWDGYKEVTTNLSKNIVTEKYSITQNFHWDTSLHGRNKNIVNDTDEVTLSNDSIFGPQNNQSIVITDKYNITKDKYVSYTDATIVNDNEEFLTNGNLSSNPKFFVHKDGNFQVLNTINYYNGYYNETSTRSLTLTASVLNPVTEFKYSSRAGINKIIEGRDDEVTFSNLSFLKDFYDTDFSKTSTRNLSIDWRIKNYKTKDNYSTIINTSTVFSENEDNTDEFLAKDILFQPKVNYYTARTNANAQEASMTFYYNDGYFNRSSLTSKFVKTVPYANLIPGATFTGTVPNRNTDITFIDNSTVNETRIIDIDWSLTDRYEANSMSTASQGTDNLQEFKNIDRLTSISTKINSFENHTLSQDIIRWDDGFKEVHFTNSYIIATTKYTINPNFTYSQEFVTGPEIIFTNTSTANGLAIPLEYDYEISDKNNDGTDASAEYRDIPFATKEAKHTYKSVSNSPFETDLYNKHVILFQDFDDGWNKVHDTKSKDILVKPNRISQAFITEPLRHLSDTETADNIITGNNPIKFFDNLTSERLNKSFIKSVKYVVTEQCT